MTIIHDIRSRTPRTNPTRSVERITHIARHHSATTEGNFDTFMKHWKAKGWGTGGYHEIILRDGSVQLCYDPTEITNGIAGHNTPTYHITVVGNGSFTDAQEKTFKERCQFNMKRFGVPIAKVLGHNEFPGTSTACPGINMDTVRKNLSGGIVKVSNPVKDYYMVGDEGKAVKDMQADYEFLGYKLAVDGVFGKGTESVVEAFQKQHGLLVDGIHGKGTDAKLEALVKAKVNSKVKPVVKKPVLRKVIADDKSFGAFTDEHNLLSAIGVALKTKPKSITITEV